MSSSSNAGGQRPSFYCLIHFYKRYSRCDLLQIARSWSERVARVKTDTWAKKGGHEFKLKCRGAIPKFVIWQRQLVWVRNGQSSKPRQRRSTRIGGVGGPRLNLLTVKALVR